MLRLYYPLTKPGIIFGNLVTTASGFLFASRGNIDLFLLCQTLIGLLCVIASSCICNNLIDQIADSKMDRTKNRPLVTGEISSSHALIFAACMGVIGFTLLIVYTNYLAALLAAVGFCIYVFLYSTLKYTTSHATLIGSISGAMPPVAGYCAVKGELDLGAFLLFMILVLWQMPHFFAIALYRIHEYRQAGIPVLPLEKGVARTKKEMLFYSCCFMLSALSMTLFGYAGGLYCIVSLVLGIAWIGLSLEGFQAVSDEIWAKKMFLFSLVLINGLCLTLSIDYF